MRKVNGLATLLIAALLPRWALAHTMIEAEFVCPLTQTTFTATVDASGSQFCRRADLKPIGATPAPWTVPVCPDDGVPVFKESFTADELTRLRAVVASPEWRSQWRAESTHYRIAVLQQSLGVSADEIGWLYVQASWQVEADALRYRRYLIAALRAYADYLRVLAVRRAAAHGDRAANAPEAAMPYVTAVLLSAELARRLERFVEAQQLVELARVPAQGQPGSKQWHELLAQAIARRDAGRVYMTGIGEEPCANCER